VPLGPYVIEVRLGRGGMGTVYRAEHRTLRQLRAIKVLPPDLAEDHEFVQRFEREARIAAGLHHPNIVLIYDIGDYAVKRAQPERLLAVADEGEKVAPAAKRGQFYRAVGLVLQNKQPDEAERFRIETGVPRWGHELDESVLPAEAGLDRIYNTNAEGPFSRDQFEASFARGGVWTYMARSSG